ncbi:leukotriene A-4 hydrolase-like isoform X1 [Mercenaria mercenaria]|uniref:leukotriene A-4 hydrolase-like isoform X1 n=1 Tax=Mercenaria mercenaria TaxID=6596 RepID=UPI00234F3B4F|nr:leukotriene A-4 hydrolase-like isoform X1 [Mercenaria mercenaria]XP_053377258.1 leukotriene A-4 hydrolase-like isoform X1 [Mercenaria mercenaria]
MAPRKGLSDTDPTSFSNPDKVVVTDIDLDLEVDFKRHVLAGVVNLSLKKLIDGVDTVILDTRDVTVHSVIDKQTGQQLEFVLGEKLPAFGSKLEVRLPTTAQKSCDITIKYETSPECSALQWLRPEQTAGKRQPYLFSQCQAIHCRSMIPCQDTPYVKCPYTAKITAPSEIKILMSALLEKSEPSPDTGKTVYSFRQKTPMPSYLIAIVGGDIVSRKLGPRSHVWSEPELVERSAFEFDETEKMLKTAEDLLGPYVWGHYDLLVLPPSFPYGGMENPCLTFVTPTLLAGDRSLADVVAHEISHSWTGNLVTNKTWDDFWLNEGNTMFVERKIAARLTGGEPFRQFKALCGWNTLIETVDVLGREHAYTKLVQDTRGVDPDDSFSSIPYEKGHAFLFYLEQLLGGPDVFEPFMKVYIENFKYKSITTADWKDFLLSYFHEQTAAGVFDNVDWDGWLYGVGMPPVRPRYDMTMAESCETLARRWLDSSEEQLTDFTYSDIEKFLPVQTEQFLATFLNHTPLSHAKIVKMRDTYKFSEVQNSEIKFRWLRVCIRAQYEPAIQPALQFVTEQGRMKFVKPIYRDLYNWETSRAQAISTFEANRNQMHSTTANTVAKVLYPE